MELGGIGIGIGIDKMELTPCLVISECVAYPSSQGNKWRLRLVQFNGLFNNPRTQ